MHKHTHTYTQAHSLCTLSVSLSLSRSHFSADYLSVELEEVQSAQVIVYSQRKGTEMLTVPWPHRQVSTEATGESEKNGCGDEVEEDDEMEVIMKLRPTLISDCGMLCHDLSQ